MSGRCSAREPLSHSAAERLAEEIMARSITRRNAEMSCAHGARIARACGLGLGAALVLAGCARVLQTADQLTGGGSSEAEITNVAAPRAFHVGDSFSYDTGTARGPIFVTAISDGRVAWADNLGDKWTGFADPTVPPVEEFNAKDGTSVKRVYTPATPSVFPLAPGKQVTYRARVTRSSDPAPSVDQSTCKVSRPRPLTVAAGSFDTWEIVCQRATETDTYYYAPKIGAVVLESHDGNGVFQRLALIGYQAAGSSVGASGENSAAPIMPALPRQPVTTQALAMPSTPAPPPAPVAAPVAAPKPAPAPAPMPEPVAAAPPAPQAAPTTPTAAATPPAEVSPQILPAVQEPTPPQAPSPTPTAAPAAAPKPAPSPMPTPAAAQTRPAPLAPTTAPAPQVADAPAPSGLVPAPNLPSGVYMVQLGAMHSFDAAHQAWVNARNNAPQLLAELTPRVDPIETSNGATLVRLSVGPFPTSSDASRVCDALRAARLECFVRRTP
jgi:hypothetical protein